MANIFTREIKTINDVTGMFYGVEADSYEEAVALIENCLPEDTEKLKEIYYNQYLEELLDELKETYC